MSNNLSVLTPTLFSAAKKVAAEPFGVISAINSNFDNKGVAKGDTVTVPIAPVRVASDFAPAAIPSAGDDSVASSIGVQITKARKVSWNITGEQLRSLANADSDKDWVEQMVMQGMRTLRNECEKDAALAVKVGASRAYGTAGTTPFASDLSALTNARKILQDNGAPLADLQFIGDTSAGLNLRNLNVIQQAYAAGSDEERRTGVFQRQFGFKLTESAGIGQHTPGTGASYVLNGAHAIGQTALNVQTGTGTLLPGDVIAVQGDPNKYVVTGALAGGVVTIGAPGLRVAQTGGQTVTVGAAYTANLAFERSACVGVMRPPIMPPNATISQRPISDPLGMTYLMLEIQQYGMTSWELHLAWGFKSVNGEFSAIVQG